MALAKNPDWLKSHTVTGMDFGGDAEPQYPRNLPQGAANPDAVIKALLYQLGERLAFVRPPDPLVGTLIADLADLLQVTRDGDFSAPVYQLALDYQPPSYELLGRRYRHAETHRSKPFGRYALVLLATVGVGLAGFMAWRRRNP